MGIIYVQGDVFLGGRIRGKGMIITEGDIIIEDSLVYDGADAFLSLVALNGKIKVNDSLKSAKVESAIYAKKSMVGGEKVNIFGNLVVDTLNRQDGEDGPLIMPKKVMIEYDSKLKSEVGSNVCFNISRQISTFRDL
jgi:hypothetical protein